MDRLIEEYVYYDKQILKGLVKVPTPGTPGLLIVTGESQAVFTGFNPGEVILAASKYGQGRIFVSAHDCYLNWLNEKSPGIKKDFMDNVKAWLTKSNSVVEDSEIGELGELKGYPENFPKYKIIKWRGNIQLSPFLQTALLNYVDNGGALFCGVTPWGHLQIFGGSLKDMTMFNFLKDFTGIILSPHYIGLPDEMDVSSNQAKLSNFDIASQKIQKNPQKINKYMNTIQSGIDLLNEEGLLSEESILNLKCQVMEQCESSSLNVTPSGNKAVRQTTEKNAVKLIGKCLIYAEGEKAPNIKEFPGDYDECPPLLEGVELNLKAKFEESVSTGYYLPAAINLLVNVNSGDVNNWEIRIGAHTDDISGSDAYGRWPCVYVNKKLASQLSLYSPYGGLIYFVSHGPGELNVTLTNVVESPFIDLTLPETIDDWNRRRNAVGLWAELASENIIFTTPSACIRNLEDPTEVLKFWDQVVKTHHECRGTNPSDQRRERVVNDLQPSCGYMHSGYPIVTHLDCCEPSSNECIFDIEKLLKNGSWGLFHELGHNMQRGEWTFDGAGEVTVNIFSMHANQFVRGQDIIDQSWPRDRIGSFEEYFSKQPNYEDWKENCGMALMVFAQLIKHFGWEAMHQFMADYERDIKANHPSLPKNNQDKIDQWVLRYSRIVNRNIKPQFEMFGLPVSDFVDNELTDLEPWCPVEEKDPNIFFSKL